MTSIKSSSSPSSLPAPYYDYCRIPAENGANTQSEERVYATIQSPLRLTQGDIDGTQIAEHNDYTVIYEDPTSPSYVVGTQTMGTHNRMMPKGNEYSYYSRRCTLLEVCLTQLGPMYRLW